MTEENQCGPETDSDFFYELRVVFEKYPDAAQTYSIHCRTLENDIMRIDLERQVGVSRIEGDQIITEFRDSEGVSQGHCCEWVYTGAGPHGWTCVMQCLK